MDKECEEYWKEDPVLGEWYYSFKDEDEDEDGKEWTINLIPWYECMPGPFEAYIISDEKEISLGFPGRYVDDDIDQLKNDALRRTAALFPKVHFPELSLHLYHMTQYIDETLFKEVIERGAKVKKYLWIGTADIKDLYVEERPSWVCGRPHQEGARSTSHPRQGAGAELPGRLRPLSCAVHRSGACAMPQGAFQDYHLRPQAGLHRQRRQTLPLPRPGVDRPLRGNCHPLSCAPDNQVRCVSGSAPYQNPLLRYRICVPCSKRLPGVRDAFSEARRKERTSIKFMT